MKPLLNIQPMLVVLVILILLVVYVIGVYNTLVKGRLKVEEAFSTMDVQMKKRYDLIPNVVNTVKGYASHEKDTLEAVIKARNTALAAPTPQEQLEAEGDLNRVMSRLLMLQESYPELKANENFLQLQNQLGDIEKEIAQARKFYNATVRRYNNDVLVFPKVIIANMFGFEKAPMFEITDEAQREPVTVSFD